MKNTYLKKIIFGLFLSQCISFGATNPFVPAASSAATAATSVTSSASSSVLSVQSLISNLGNLTGSFDSLFPTDNNTSINNQISSLNKIAGCFGVSLLNTGLSGLCGSLGNLGIGGLGGAATSLLSCAGVNLGDIGNLNLSSICSNAANAAITGSSSGSGSVVMPSGVGHNGMSMISTGSASMAATGDGTKDSPFKKPADTKYPSGKTGEQVANHFSEAQRTNPTSSAARSWLNLDNASLVLKQNALMLAGTDNESLLKLPETKAKGIEEENQMAFVMAAAAIQHDYEKDQIRAKAILTYTSITADTVSEYRVKETEKFNSEIKGSAEVTELFKREENFVNMKYSIYEFQDMGDPNYIFDPSDERTKWITPEKRNDYIFLSLLQKSKSITLKAEAAVEKEIRREIIDITVKRAYYSSSVFPAGIAEKEINTLLEAVDTAIK